MPEEAVIIRLGFSSDRIMSLLVAPLALNEPVI
ncbi:uncharacterized protein METZ01_LOCUS365690 [marine metagenome]|uniref:Uncharacterized protein n=1 Tax=marine metagenome TaxID=408172 RepID=A0A382SSJ9_9ZZZZ